MESPSVEIKYVDNTETNGYLQIIVNGIIQPSIRVGFDAGNTAAIHSGLSKVVEAVYKMGVADGERTGKQKIKSLLNWANSR
jgi:hypothetical protein